MKLKSPTWVFLRGLTRESGHWGEFPKQFGDVFKGQQVITPDVAGMGARWNERSPDSIPEIVQDLRRTTQLDSQEILIFSISMGGMLGVEWIKQEPERVRGIVLINSSFRGVSAFYKRLRYQSYVKILSILSQRDVFKREAQISELVLNREDLRPAATFEWAQLARKHPVLLENFFHQLRAAASYSLPLEVIKVPSLILTSTNDQLVDSTCSKEMHRRWPGSTLEIHPEAGHDLCYEEPTWVVNKVQMWWKKHYNA